MSNVVQFEEFADSGRGFLARPILPNNVPAIKANISEITYEVHETGNSTPSASGVLDPAVVMFDEMQTWKFDSDGYSFWWAVPGELWPLPNTFYRIIVSFLIEAPGNQMHGKAFKLVWEAQTVDPVGAAAG